MGLDSIGKQELPPDLFDWACIYCDLPAQSRVIGEFQHATRGTELVAIGDVLSGRTEGRQSPEDVTVFDSSGLSIQDLFVVQAVLNLIEE